MYGASQAKIAEFFGCKGLGIMLAYTTAKECLSCCQESLNHVENLNVLPRTSQASRAVHVGFVFDFVPSGAEAGTRVDGEGEHGVHAFVASSSESVSLSSGRIR